jgi:hypothetical protein
VEILAREQMRSIDVATPSSPISAAAASERGMVPLWLSLARQAETAHHLIQGEMGNATVALGPYRRRHQYEHVPETERFCPI